MTTMELYQLINEADEPVGSVLYEFFQEADAEAKAHNLAVEALVFEYCDVEMVVDYREKADNV